MTVPEKQMAATRYGRIHHGSIIHNNIKFPSPAAREKFAQEFKKYHASHDHDGEVPRFEMVKAADIKSYQRQAKDADDVTIDGYAWYEIKKYHNREDADTYTHYRPPTCCVSPIIVLEREFIDSGTLERHELSSIFGDMPDGEFQNLMKSVEQDGFMDPLIRMCEGKILDGWHRYRAALELNLVRKLMFNPWDEEKEGAAVAFVAARNIERRHLPASQRAQIVVSLNERFGWGGDRSKSSNEPLKTQEELATQARVSRSSIKRAVQVEKAGESEAVISGEKSASQVISQREAEKALKQKKKLCKLMWDTRQEATRIYIADADSDLNQWLSLDLLEKGFAKSNPTYAEAFVSAMKRTTFFSLQNCIDKVLESQIDIDILENEHRALRTYVGDLRQWQREDWSPDTNWILHLIAQKKAVVSALKKADTKPESEPESDDLKTLWEKVTAQIPKWKQKYKESGYKENDLVSRASKSMLIQALRAYRESEETDTATIEELKDLLYLLKSQSYPLAYHLRKICGGTTDDQTPAETEETCPETDSEDPEAESLDDLYLSNLITILRTLLNTVGEVENQADRDNLCVSVYKVFEQFEGITEREQLSILIDWAYTLVTETEANA